MKCFLIFENRLIVFLFEKIDFVYLLSLQLISMIIDFSLSDVEYISIELFLFCRSCDVWIFISCFIFCVFFVMDLYCGSFTKLFEKISVIFFNSSLFELFIL